MPNHRLTHTLVLAHADRDYRARLAAELDLDGYSGHETNRYSNVVEGLQRVEPSLLLLGPLEQPSASPRLLRALRAGELPHVARTMPVITIGPADDLTRTRAYEDGSDHHVEDGIAYGLLRAILAAVLRRVTAAAPRGRERFEVGALVVDLATREVTADGEPVKLTTKEFELLRVLASEPDRVFTKQQLLSDVWGYPDPRSTRTLDSHACRLRSRLAGHGQRLVTAHWGVGYRLLP